MIDGLTVVMSNEKIAATLECLAKQSVYNRKESMMDCEKYSFYLADGTVWTVVLYFDPRHDQKHEHPRRAILHHVMTQFENFMFHQLDAEGLWVAEQKALDFALTTDPTLIYFDYQLGFWDTEHWRGVFPFYTGMASERARHIQDANPKSPNENVFVEDFHFVRGRLKISLYNWNGLQLKFYRLNPKENRNHYAKYPFGYEGYTKCEIVTPKFTLYSVPDAKKILNDTLVLLRVIRENLLGSTWDDHCKQVATKLCARSDRIHIWSCTEQNLQGSMEMFETEMTRREQLPLKAYTELLENVMKLLQPQMEVPLDGDSKS
jgi:hypothetical protein